ncbi:RNA polymerase I-associated factor PAF67-domain-containing protein [Chytridium lagenaria]|nr:RNA polymerase I-associated factor PAF67-domain-containing protein [Chytridium lagenaria]
MYQGEQFDEDEVVAEEVELPTVYTGDFTESYRRHWSIFSQGQFLPQDIPDVVTGFLRRMHQAISERSGWELHSLYENQIFLILYKELYYRHVYSKLQPTLEDRLASYANYCDLFNFILNNSSEPTDLELPNQWLWDIIDEFIYQFQAFCQYRSKVQNKTEAEVEILKERPDVWNVLNVLNVLYSLIQKSRINEQLHVSKNGGDMLEAAGEFGSRPLYRMLGYFSIVGLLRVHCLLGDYTMALKTMENIELSKKGLFARVTACHITTYYYIGFSYMMMRRYSDAIKAFSHILLFVSRTKQYHTRSYQYEVISKKCEQMYALLVMAVTLMPQRIDENVHTAMREKYGEQLAKLQKEGEESLPVYEELYLFACPKFISPAPPKFDEVQNMSQAPTQLQLRVYLDDIRQQILVPTIRSYLKLYTTLRISKLASFLDKSPEELRTELLCYKHKTSQRRYESGSVLDGDYATNFDLDFHIKDDMIHIVESKAGRRIGDWFIRHIEKFDDTIANLDRKA